MVWHSCNRFENAHFLLTGSLGLPRVDPLAKDESQKALTCLESFAAECTFEDVSMVFENPVVAIAPQIVPKDVMVSVLQSL